MRKKLQRDLWISTFVPVYPVSQNILSNALCTAALLPELKPAPCFLSAIIGQID